MSRERHWLISSSVPRDLMRKVYDVSYFWLVNKRIIIRTLEKYMNCLKKNLNASGLSEHPTQGGKCQNAY